MLAYRKFQTRLSQKYIFGSGVDGNLNNFQSTSTLCKCSQKKHPPRIVAIFLISSLVTLLSQTSATRLFLSLLSKIPT